MVFNTVDGLEKQAFLWEMCMYASFPKNNLVTQITEKSTADWVRDGNISGNTFLP